MKFKTFKRNNSGFTLIELLVVIGILGILAAGLLLTIDPLEKFKQGNDTNTQQAAVDLENALTSYYANHSAYPWDPTTSGGGGCNSGTAPTNGSSVGSSTAWNTPTTGCTAVLISAGELKTTFAGATATTNQLYFSLNSNTPPSPIICFAPQSKSMQSNANAQFSQTGGAWSSGPKYWCAQ